MKYTLIYAMTEERGIGRDGKLLHHIVQDLQHFRYHTMNQSIIMGAATYLELKKPLKNRKNYVFVKSTALQRFRKSVPNTIDSNITIVTEKTWKNVFPVDSEKTLFVIGGAQLFEYVIENHIAEIDRVIETIIYGSYQKPDVFMPASIDGVKRLLELESTSKTVGTDAGIPTTKITEFEKFDMYTIEFNIFKRRNPNTVASLKPRSSFRFLIQ